MDYAEAARNNVQDDAVAFLQIRFTDFIYFCFGLVGYFCFVSQTVLVSRPS